MINQTLIDKDKPRIWNNWLGEESGLNANTTQALKKCHWCLLTFATSTLFAFAFSFFFTKMASADFPLEVCWKLEWHVDGVRPIITVYEFLIKFDPLSDGPCHDWILLHRWHQSALLFIECLPDAFLPESEAPCQNSTSYFLANNPDMSPRSSMPEFYLLLTCQQPWHVPKVIHARVLPPTFPEHLC